jgi:hypothetical protein
LRDSVSAADFGTVGDNSTDDGSKLQLFINAIPANGRGVLPAGIYITGQELTFPNNGVTLDLNGATIKAKAGAQFEYILKATSRTGIVVRNGTLDANQANRATGQTVRFMGGGFIDCDDCKFVGVLAQNVLGYGAVPGVGLTIGGVSNRCNFEMCSAINCGTALLPADGFFMSGNNCLGIGCTAQNCFDTGFVVESSNNSGYSGCTAKNCSGGAAITNASASDVRGNFLSAVTIIDWNSAVTGGVQIGVPTATAGNLLDSEADVIVLAPTGGKGTGPAINVRQNGSGKAIGLRLTGRINTASTQGVLIDGDDVTVTMDIQGTASNAVQVQTGRTGARIVGLRIKAGTNGVATTGTAVCEVSGCDIAGQSGYNIYAFDTSTVTATMNKLGSAGIANTGKDGGATLYRIEQSNNTLVVNGAQVLATRATGWTVATGTPQRGAFAAAAAGTASGAYVQAELQGALNRIAVLEARLLATQTDLTAHGLIGA